MAMVIRDVREHELDSVLALNNAAGAGILPIDADRLRFFWRHAAYFRVAETEGHLAGFLIALMPDASYDSPNFSWFRDRYPEFVYIDRIVIAGAHRGAGLGRIFYADVQSFAEVRTPRLACEVFVTLGSDPALLFTAVSVSTKSASRRCLAAVCGFRFWSRNCAAGRGCVRPTSMAMRKACPRWIGCASARRSNP